MVCVQGVEIDQDSGVLIKGWEQGLLLIAHQLFVKMPKRVFHVQQPVNCSSGLIVPKM